MNLLQSANSETTKTFLTSIFTGLLKPRLMQVTTLTKIRMKKVSMASLEMKINNVEVKHASKTE